MMFFVFGKNFWHFVMISFAYIILKGAF